MGASGQSCPRCHEPIGHVELRGIGLDGCQKCHGMAVPVSRLAGVLEAASVDLLKDFDPETRIDPVEDRGGSLDCPSCGRKMAKDNYCAAGLVFFERCNGCGLVWLEADALGTMTLMWARMDSRVAQTRADLRERDAALNSTARRALVKRAVIRMVLWI